MKKILFYCQYLAGMGHLVRSREIVRGLVQDFQVCLVIGGAPIADFAVPEGAEVVYLPALREEAGELLATDQSVEDVKASRVEKLLAVFDQFQPDCVITECFPFSKYKMSFELVPLLERAKATQVKVVCSLRDLIMTQAMSEKGLTRKKARIHEQIRRYYDLVLYHCDRNLQPLESCFPTAPELDCEVFYTGYVAQSPASTTTEQIRSPSIIASVGGGRDGYPLLKTMMETSVLLQQAIPHHIYAFAGPFMPDEQFQSLESFAKQQSNVTLSRFTPNLMDCLSQADLSVSLGGYNTTMNVLRTGVRSLISPSPSVDQADEQRLRATLLTNKGAVDLLTPEQLNPEGMAQAILGRLAQPQPCHSINLDGAKHASERLRSLLQDIPISQLVAAA
ncbi:MAG: glycosyltransferase family protein [Thermosynechococcaceae cyanobacterium]